MKSIEYRVEVLQGSADPRTLPSRKLDLFAGSTFIHRPCDSSSLSSLCTSVFDTRWLDLAVWVAYGRATTRSSTAFLRRRSRRSSIILHPPADGCLRNLESCYLARGYKGLT